MSEQSKEAILKEISQNSKALIYTKGNSMLPMLKEGRDISVLVIPSGNLKVGDVVLYERPKNDNMLVLHRIVKVVSDGKFLIRGDNTYYDEPVTRENIMAVLEGFFRKGRYINCKESKRYRIYAFAQVRLYFIKKFFRKTLRQTGANIKNNVFHLNNLHLDDFLKRK